MSRNIRSQSYRKELRDNVFDRLNKAAIETGVPSKQALHDLGKDIHLSVAVTYGSATFYDYLGEENSGRKVWPCEGTACRLGGGDHSEAGNSLCVGYCYAGNGVLRKDSEGHFSTHNREGETETQPAMPVYSFATTPVLTSKTENINELYDGVQNKTSEILVHLQASKLRGRGGAGFPFAMKLQACAEQVADQKYIVCNADEGDPGAFSDRYLLEQQPHKIMAGMFAAALVAGAGSCILYIRREYPEAITACRQAIEAFKQLPASMSDRVEFHIIEGAGSYVCGEETALLNSIEGLRPEVRVRPPYPAVYGLWGKPTIVSNVETFANIPWILEHGGEAYALIGTRDSTGTKLISLDARFTRPGLYEVDFGTSFDELVYEMAGGFTQDIKAVQVGGPLGSVIPVQRIKDLKIEFADFQQAGFALGHAGIIAIPQDYPLIDFLRHLFSYMAHESCGKCTPCRVGTNKGALMLKEAGPDKPMDYGLMTELLDVLETGSLCALGGGLPLPVRNCLEHFKPEFEDYFTNWEAVT